MIETNKFPPKPLSRIVHEGYDGVVVRKPDGGHRRVMRGELIPTDWLGLPDNDSVADMFKDVKFVRLRGRYVVCIECGAPFERETATTIRCVECGRVLELENEYARVLDLTNLGSDRIGLDDPDDCPRWFARKLQPRWDGKKDEDTIDLNDYNPGTLEEAIREANEKVEKYDPVETLERYKEYNEIQNRRREMGNFPREWVEFVGAERGGFELFGREVSVQRGDVIPRSWAQHAGVDMQEYFKQIPGRFYTDEEIGKIRNQKDGDWEKVGSDMLEDLRYRADQYDQVVSVLAKKASRTLINLDYNVVNAVASIVGSWKAQKADLDGLRDRKFDGTMFSRTQNPGVVRKRVSKLRTPCDDQSGEDVCADADRWRGGPR